MAPSCGQLRASVPFHCTCSRQSLGLAAVLLPVKHLPVQIAELHLIIVQQAQTPWHEEKILGFDCGKMVFAIWMVSFNMTDDIPMPAAARYCARGQPSPPQPTTNTEVLDRFNCPVDNQN